MGKEDLIWTKHALQRLKERGLTQSDAWATWRNPDLRRPAQTKGNWIYYKTFGNQKLEVVVAKKGRGESVVVSVWSKFVSERKQNKNFFVNLLRKIFGL
jgi:hypothetical protein